MQKFFTKTVFGQSHTLPIIHADFPDPCVAVKEDVAYMTSTSMHYMPGVPIMQSKDLQQWKRLGYVYTQFENNDAHHLRNAQNIYGKGSWATSFLYHAPYFYLCFNSNDTQKTYIYRTKDLEAKDWERFVFEGSRHDPSMLFDEGKLYIVYGNGVLYYQTFSYGEEIRIESEAKLLLDTGEVDGLNCEGAHWHYQNGYYYLFLIQWSKTGSGRRIQWVYRSKRREGPYEGKIILDEDIGFYNNGIAQGGIFSFKGKDYCMLFQDRGALGRVPILFDLEWDSNWPVLKKEGIHKNSLANMDVNSSDDFSYDLGKRQDKAALKLHWQWNHIPDPSLYSLKAKEKHLRLFAGPAASSLTEAKNVLTQMPKGNFQRFTVKVDASALAEGESAALACFHDPYAYVALCREKGELYLKYVHGQDGEEELKERFSSSSEVLYLRLDMNFQDLADTASFAYSLDGEKWKEMDSTFSMQYRLKHFVGNRAALCVFGREEGKGYADFSEFTVS